MTAAPSRPLRPPVPAGRVPSRRVALAAVMVLCAAGCGGGVEHVAVTPPSTAAPVAGTSPSTTTSTTGPTGPTTTAPTTTAPTTTGPTGTAPPTTAPTNPTGSTAPTCRASALAVDDVPLSAGTGLSQTAWSVSNTAATACTLPGGVPTIAFADRSGTTVSRYTDTTATSPGPSVTLRLAPGGKAWFPTTETTTACGVGTTLAGGPFHYVVGLPGVGPVTWAPAYLAGATLTDFCADESFALGALRATEPAAPA